jgi:hypothetical protein
VQKEGKLHWTARAAAATLTHPASVCFKQCKQSITVHTLDLVIKASSLSPKFDAKDFIVRTSTVKRFMHAHSLVYHMGMHESQYKPDEVTREASGYIDVMH